MTTWLNEWLTDWLDAKEARNRVFVSKKKKKTTHSQLGQHQWVKNSILLLCFIFCGLHILIAINNSCCCYCYCCCCCCLFNTFTYVDISILLCFVVAPPLVGVCLLWLCLALFGFTLFSYLNASYFAFYQTKKKNISNNFENVIRNSALRRTFCNVQVEFSVLCPHCWNVHK